jgi:hypothetical protein
MRRYGYLSRALCEIYPEYDWEVWKFNPIPRGFFGDLENHATFVTWLAELLEIHHPDQWYNVHVSIIIIT